MVSSISGDRNYGTFILIARKGIESNLHAGLRVLFLFLLEMGHQSRCEQYVMVQEAMETFVVDLDHLLDKPNTLQPLSLPPHLFPETKSSL